MNILALPTRHEGIPADLSELLKVMMRYGQPRLGIYGTSGWHCSVNMNTNTTGTSFEVKSDFNLADPYLAAKQCMERIHSALEALKR